ncbi:MAG TPA: Uma2 family endonuclease [Bryobacteraceae bacterium]|jgi:Uma2 family endonuclease
MATVTAAPWTIEDFARLPADGARHELNAGELITLPPVKSLHSRIARSIFIAIQAILDRHGLYEAFTEAGYVLSRNPLTIRQPDISVLSRERIRATAADSYFEGAPDLAVEIVSPSDSAEDLEIKVNQYLQGGAKQVWVAYPKTRKIHVFSSGTAPIILDQDQTLEGGDLLPGFSAKVADLFAI